MSAATEPDPRSTTWTPDPRPWGWPDALALLAWTAAVAGYFFDVVTFRGALFYFDITEINFAYRDFLAEGLRAGRLPRWHPGLYCGLPLYSESQAGYFHPLKYLLYPWLPTWKAFNLDMVASVWLTGAATYGWLRRHVGAVGALTGAAVFGFGGFTWAHFVHSSMNNALTSVPLAVWALESTWAGGRLRGVALGAMALACQVFAGHLQDTLLTAMLLGLYGLYRAATEPTRRGRAFALGAAAGLVGLGVALSAVQWVPSKELLDRSPRAGGLTWEQLTYGSWSPELLPTLVVREAYGTRARDTDWMDGFYPYHEMDAYLGLTALGLSVLGAAARRDRWVAFWILLAGVGSLLMLGRYTALFDLAHRIPILGSSRIPVRFHLWVSLAVAALAAVGADRLARPGMVRLRGAVGLMTGMVVLSIPILVYVYAPVWTEPGRWSLPYHRARYNWLGDELAWASARTLLLTLAGLALAARARRIPGGRARELAAAGLPLVVLLDLLGAHAHDVPTVTPAYWTEPPESARRLRSDPTFVRLYGVAGKSAGEPGYASEPVDFLPVRDPLAWSLPPVWGLRSSIGETPITGRRLIDYFNQSMATGGRFDVEGVTHLAGGRPSGNRPVQGEVVGSAVIRRNERALPRARLMGDPEYADGQAGAVAALARLGPAIRDRLVVEDPDRPLPPGAPVSGVAELAVDEPERVVVRTRSDGPAYLVLADTFDPGWSATVDGRPAPIRPAFVAFRAVFLPPGEHEVAFSYRPAGFDLGLVVTLAGLAVALAALAWPWKLASTRPEHDTLGLPTRWPLIGLALAAAIVAGSAVQLGEDGPRVHPRWSTGFHRFTWGAGFEAMGRG